MSVAVCVSVNFRLSVCLFEVCGGRYTSAVLEGSPCVVKAADFDFGIPRRFFLQVSLHFTNVGFSEILQRVLCILYVLGLAATGRVRRCRVEEKVPTKPRERSNEYTKLRESYTY